VELGTEFTVMLAGLNGSLAFESPWVSVTGVEGVKATEKFCKFWVSVPLEDRKLLSVVEYAAVTVTLAGLLGLNENAQLADAVPD
jgi:hypothetical protein